MPPEVIRAVLSFLFVLVLLRADSIHIRNMLARCSSILVAVLHSAGCSSHMNYHSLSLIPRFSPRQFFAVQYSSTITLVRPFLKRQNKHNQLRCNCSLPGLSVSPSPFSLVRVCLRVLNEPNSQHIALLSISLSLVRIAYLS